MRKIHNLGMISVVGLLFLSGCGSSSPPPDTSAEPSLADRIASGALVWENYTKTSAGGTGTNPSPTSADYVRCKACHGWDGLGADGGYVRRSTSGDTRPNPTAGTNLSSKVGAVVAADVEHAAGRLFSVEDGTMPNYIQTGGLTPTQVTNVVDFLNTGPKLTTFADLDTMPNPVGYSFKGSTSATAGATLYSANCAGCHGADGTDTTISGVSLDAYFGSDGKYSEGFHKVMYGIANTSMTRVAAGSLTGQQTADILAYIQATFSPDYYKGGLVWENYTKTDAGGTGTNPSPTSADYVRCKACHGWDGKGAAGGYVRRDDNNGTRPNPTAGTDLSVKMAAGTFVAAEVEHAAGRAFTTEDTTMPDYTATGGLNAKQVADVVAFLNSGPKVTDHATLDIVSNPAVYTFTGTSATAGATLYAANCEGCHGSDGAQRPGEPTDGLGAYFASDGKYSEGFHKMVYGISNTIMTRKAAGNLTSQETADILTYIQTNLGATFPTP